MIILGVDPGTRATGFGVVSVEGRKERLVEFGVIRPRVGADHPERLNEIYASLVSVIERTLPDTCAVEMPIFGSNVQAMLKLGRAQAAAMLAALHRQVPVTQYTPKEVKKSVTGNGSAAKEQVSFMVCSLLELASIDSLDASDALAVALCHAHRNRSSGPSGTHKDWKSFVAANPDRVR